MRFSDEAHFPYPVLNATSNDYAEGEFDIIFEVSEASDLAGLRLRYNVILTQPEINDLVLSGKAAVGLFVNCKDTFFTDLRVLGLNSGVADFAAGVLIDRVIFQPIIWLTQDLVEWGDGFFHEEFESPINLKKGDLLALGQEKSINVGKAKFSSFESIFELNVSSDISDDAIQVDLESERIVIYVNHKMYLMLSDFRENPVLKSLLMSAVYLPAVMEVIDMNRSDVNYDEWRWYKPFMAKCDANGIDLKSRDLSSLQAAQKLLGEPLGKLDVLVGGFFK